MNLKNTLHLFTLFLFAAFTLTSCSDECEREVENLKDLNKYVPYTGTETLRFLHNSTDTQTFIGQGMERFFVSTSDEGCVTDHESVRIRFKNTQSNDEIKMEYVYKPNQGGLVFNFAYQGNDVGERLLWTLKNKVYINSYEYDYVNFYSHSMDTPTYLAFRSSFYSGQSGLLKIKYPNDTLEIIQ